MIIWAQNGDSSKTLKKCSKFSPNETSMLEEDNVAQKAIPHITFCNVQILAAILLFALWMNVCIIYIACMSLLKGL